MRVTHPGLGAEKTRDAWRTSAAPSRAGLHPPSARADDQISLSRLHEALSVPGGNHRLDALASQVSRATYRVPAHEISHSLLAETLCAIW